ncbi:MAG: hypothetical protein NWF06_00725 [Candidatus Bathyarchaeota archaeon]|nr:hypothetical protein [Candidatus Bathyarchaeum sp.]
MLIEQKLTLREKGKILHDDVEYLLKSFQKYRTGIMISIEGESAEVLRDIQGLVRTIQSRKQQIADENVLLQDRAIDYEKLLQYIINELGANKDE